MHAQEPYVNGAFTFQWWLLGLGAGNRAKVGTSVVASRKRSECGIGLATTKKSYRSVRPPAVTVTPSDERTTRVTLEPSRTSTVVCSRRQGSDPESVSKAVRCGESETSRG